MRLNYRKLGDYIQQVNLKNTDGKLDTLVGVNLDKKFMPSVANTIGTDLTKYKVIKKGQFGCKFMSVGRDGKLPISLMQEYDAALISSAYYVFEVKDENELLSEYLMMWLSRSENDRYLWFMSGADVRGSISWDDFCSIDINIPSIEKQREIVKEYKTITERIKLNEQLNQKLEETAQAIYKEWFVDFEFPDKNGKPYKSSGGEIKYCDELGMEVPKGWTTGMLSNIMEYSKEKIPLSKLSTTTYISTENMIENRGGVTTASSLPTTEKVSSFHKNNILISNIRPYFKKIWLAEFDGGCSNDILCVKAKNIDPLFLYFILEQDNFFDYVMAGSKGTKMPRGDKDWILQYPIIIPKEEQLRAFSKITSHLKSNINIKMQLTKCLKALSATLLSKMLTIEG